MRIRNRWPRFGDTVLLEGRRFRMCATVVAPSPGYWVRPAEAEDAAANRFVTPAEWAALVWDTRAQRWEAAA